MLVGWGFERKEGKGGENVRKPFRAIVIASPDVGTTLQQFGEPCFLLRSRAYRRYPIYSLQYSKPNPTIANTFADAPTLCKCHYLKHLPHALPTLFPIRLDDFLHSRRFQLALPCSQHKNGFLLSRAIFNKVGLALQLLLPRCLGILPSY